MYEILRENQLNVMLVLTGICEIIAVFVLISKNMTKMRKFSLATIELAAMFLMIFDRLAYLYRGNTSDIGYYIVRISNFFVFFFVITTVGAFNIYLTDLLKNEGGIRRLPKRLNVAGWFSLAGIVLVIIAHFTGLYYTFDENNIYHREPGFIICFIIPFIVIFIQLSVVVAYKKYINKIMWVSILLFSALPLVTSIAQLFLYGLSLNNLTIATMGILLYVFSLVDMNRGLEKLHKQELENLIEKRNSMSRMFDKIGSSLLETLDGKKASTKGHSKRVANYGREIARLSGMSDFECEKVYFSGLLHDIGKIGIPDDILNKEDKLSEEEERIFQEHTSIGKNILSGIPEYAYLGESALYHHERYDGSGYPSHLKKNEIPKIARIIAIADAYDSMTSKRNYRNPLPQSKVREEFIKESGIKFDPKYTQIMIQMIDEDVDYKLKGDLNNGDYVWKKQIDCNEYREDISTGLNISNTVKKVKMKYQAKQSEDDSNYLPSVIIFDSLDGYVHTTEREIKDNNYTEYGEIWFDGNTITTRAKNIETKILSKPKKSNASRSKKTRKIINYEIEVGRIKDHIRVRIKGGGYHIESIVAIADNSRDVYMGITGEYCTISDIKYEESKVELKEGDIPRIVEEINYTNRLEADLKNIQIGSRRSVSTTGVLLKNELRIIFNTRSLPNANLVWHCPYIIIFSSDDKKVNGKNYEEYALIRLDGEIEETKEYAQNKILINKNEKFESWDKWKKLNQNGMECRIDIEKKGKNITIYTENAGISIKNTTSIKDLQKEVYLALTGDRCVLTDIRVLQV